MEQKRTNDVLITSKNVKRLGENIAIYAIKYAKQFANGKLDGLYRGLVHDVFHFKGFNDTYSDGYDYAQDAMLFLCNFIGKNVKDVYKIDKYGNKITILRACIRKLHVKLLNAKICYFAEYNLNDDIIHQKTIHFEDIEEHKKAIAKTDKMIAKMKLSKGETETLNCYMGGMTFYDIADLLEVNRSTVYRRRLSLQKKYNKTFNTTFA